MAPDAEGSRNSPLPLAVSPGAAHRSAYPMNPYKSNKILQPNHAAAGNTVVVLMQTASAVHGGGYVSQRSVNFQACRSATRQAWRFSGRLCGAEPFPIRDARARSGCSRTAVLSCLNGAGRFAAIGQQVPKVQARSGEAGLQANWPLARCHRARMDFWRTTIATPAHCARLAATSLYWIRSQSARCSSS